MVGRLSVTDSRERLESVTGSPRHEDSSVTTASRFQHDRYALGLKEFSEFRGVQILTTRWVPHPGSLRV